MLYEMYGQIIFFKGEPEFLLMFSFLSGLLSAIFASGRAARNPILTDDPYKLGGL
jgi:hypothetical protein